MRILVDGGTGFIGSYMQQTQPEGIDAYYIGKRDYDLMWWQLEKWDAIVHLANVSPWWVLLNARLKGGRVLYASSGAVYHEYPDDYGRNKRRWECECLQSGADVVIARLFCFHGEGLDNGKALTQFIAAARAGEPIVIWGDGNTVRTYMHGHKAARWLWAILLQGESGECYDVGDDKPVTMLELAWMVKKALHSLSPIVIQGGKERVPYYVPMGLDKTRSLLVV